MNPDLEKKLVEKYPNLFRDYQGNPATTCMTWGCEHGDGWYAIIASACATIAQVDKDAYFCQIKEKFGTLRMYLQGNDQAQAVATMAEYMSEMTCERCGATTNVKIKSPRGWMSNYCEDCWKELNK